MKNMLVASAVTMMLFSQVAAADICDYTLSKQIGKEASAAAGLTGDAVAVTGAGMKTAGLYTLTHAGTGSVMLGSTAVGKDDAKK